MFFQIPVVYMCSYSEYIVVEYIVIYTLEGENHYRSVYVIYKKAQR